MTGCTIVTFVNILCTQLVYNKDAVWLTGCATQGITYMIGRSVYHSDYYNQKGSFNFQQCFNIWFTSVNDYIFPISNQVKTEPINLHVYFMHNK